jgi:hypothetical protein
VASLNPSRKRNHSRYSKDVIVGKKPNQSNVLTSHCAGESRPPRRFARSAPSPDTHFPLFKDDTVSIIPRNTTPLLKLRNFLFVFRLFVFRLFVFAERIPLKSQARILSFRCQIRSGPFSGEEF